MVLELTRDEETQKETGAASLATLIQLLFGKHVTYAISAVARLGVADHMNGTPVGVDVLASETGADAPSLYRVMRMLASVGVFEERDGKRFLLTPTGELLKENAPGSLRYLAIQLGDEWSTRPWEHFTATVCTGEDGVTKAFGKNVFDLLAERPAEAETFNRSMTNISAALVDAVVDAYDFSGIERMADVGGGHGKLLAAVLQRYPQMKGVVYDLPEVVAGAVGKAHFAGCEERVEFAAGSFFERVPTGCDAYIMKFILHDWSDEHGRGILRQMRQNLPAHGRVLICEQIVADDAGPSPAKFLDLEMLALTVGGRERTEEEFRELFQSAGLRLTRVVRTAGPLCVLEAQPA